MQIRAPGLMMVALFHSVCISMYTVLKYLQLIEWKSQDGDIQEY